MSNPTDVLLDFSTPFDVPKVNLLDQVVTAMYSNNPQDVSRVTCASIESSFSLLLELT